MQNQVSFLNINLHKIQLKELKLYLKDMQLKIKIQLLDLEAEGMVNDIIKQVRKMDPSKDTLTYICISKFI